MSIFKQIETDIVAAMKAGEKDRLMVLRGLKSDLKNVQINAGSRGEEMTDEQSISVLSSCAKKRRESIEQYRLAGRTDLADIEATELSIIVAYLPAQMSEAEVRTTIQAEITRLNLSGPNATGALMKEIMPKLKGRADGKLISQIAKELLAG